MTSAEFQQLVRDRTDAADELRQIDFIYEWFTPRREAARLKFEELDDRYRAEKDAMSDTL